MTEKLRVCGKECLFWYDHLKPINYASNEVKCQIYASVHPNLYKKSMPRFNEGRKCRFFLTNSLDLRTHTFNHDELSEIANRSIESFKRKIRPSDTSAYVLAAYVAERLSYGQEEQSLPKCKNPGKIPLPCQVCLRKQKYNQCPDRNNCHALDGDHAGGEVRIIDSAHVSERLKFLKSINQANQGE